MTLASKCLVKAAFKKHAAVPGGIMRRVDMLGQSMRNRAGIGQPSMLRRAAPYAAAGAAGAGAGYMAAKATPPAAQPGFTDTVMDYAGKVKDWAGKPIYEGAADWATPTNIGLGIGGGALAVYALKKLLED